MRSPVSRFAYTKADLDVKRSQFGRSNRHLTTMSAGILYPLLVDEVLPGDTYTIDVSSLVRMSTPIHPVMDNCFLDLYFFYSPNRIVWDHWKEFMGESPDEPYVNSIEYTVPQLYCQSPGDGLYFVTAKSVMDYMGIPSNSQPAKVNALPFRHFAAIWNEWFRDQNLQNAINFSKGDEDLRYYTSAFGESLAYDNVDNDYLLAENWVDTCARGGFLPPVNKYHDYFTSALKAPQKGEPVPIPLSGMAPVYASDLMNLSDHVNYDSVADWRNDDGAYQEGAFIGVNGEDSRGSNVIGVANANVVGLDLAPAFDTKFIPTNVGADLSSLAGVYATINDLRYAFQLQKFLEKDGRNGTRYRELLKAHFGVTSPDATQQVPEFLGGKRIPINMAQVLQTSATDDVSPQGNTAAYSLTNDKFSAFTQSFTEHGFIFCVGCIRTEHTYQNGMERFWLRENKYDYYFPEFANISEQPIYNAEIYLTRHGAKDDYDPSQDKEIFGYQEAWADYRYKPNRISGEFRSNYAQSLDSWHYGDDYKELPRLSSAWIAENRENLDRTLAVSSISADQFICDFYFDMKTTRIMPVTSIPGLADHH